MPQMNKGGKFVFGESEVHFDGWVQLPPQAVDETLVDRAYFISPIVDMENLICNMMQWSNVTEQELAEKRENPLQRLPLIRSATTTCRRRKPLLMG